MSFIIQISSNAEIAMGIGGMNSEKIKVTCKYMFFKNLLAFLHC